MSVCVVTGSGGLIGSEAAKHFAGKGMQVVGIDNDMRKTFFGPEASTAWNVDQLRSQLGGSYEHLNMDIRNRAELEATFQRFGKAIELVVHCAAQPSHDWAARDPHMDFEVNANGTLNVMQSVRESCPEAVVIFTSTNKVYGDTPNRLPLIEGELRWEIDPNHTYVNGIREDMSIDQTLHSVFGASKVAADVMVQEFGRYFGIRTACFRGGTLTGPAHSATELHGFLGYVMRCAMTRTPYTIFGYKGKQVRDAIHSKDLIDCFDHFYASPRVSEVYNIGGGRFSNCSVLEAIAMSEEISGNKMDYKYSEQNRIGDHIWWIGDNGRFASHYPGWKQEYDVRRILTEIFESNRERWRPA